MRDVIYKMITDRVENTIDICISSDIPKEDWNLTELNELLLPIIPLKPITAALTDEVKDVKELKHKLKEQAVKLYEAKEAEFPEPEALRELERVILLKVIDRKWMDHIDDMDQLRQGIGLQAYGQKDPLVEYKMSGFDMFDDMIANIQARAAEGREGHGIQHDGARRWRGRGTTGARHLVVHMAPGRSVLWAGQNKSRFFASFRPSFH